MTGRRRGFWAPSLIDLTAARSTSRGSARSTAARRSSIIWRRFCVRAPRLTGYLMVAAGAPACRAGAAMVFETTFDCADSVQVGQVAVIA